MNHFCDTVFCTAKQNLSKQIQRNNKETVILITANPGGPGGPWSPVAPGLP